MLHINKVTYFLFSWQFVLLRAWKFTRAQEIGVCGIAHLAKRNSHS
jgi:hypothetical protein